MPEFNKASNPSCGVDVTDWRGATRYTGDQAGSTGRTTGGQLTLGTGAFFGSIAGGALVNGVAANGQTWSYAAMLKLSVARTVRHYCSRYNGTSFVDTFGTATDLSAAANTWYLINKVVTIPSSGTWTRMHIHLDFPTSGSAGTAKLAVVRFAAGNLPSLALGDGAFPGWEWDGTAELSTSTKPDPVGGLIDIGRRRRGALLVR